MKYLSTKNKLIDPESARESNIMVDGSTIKKNTTYVFNSTKELLQWSKRTKLAKIILDAEKRIRRAKRFQNKPDSYLMRRQKLLIRRVEQDVGALARHKRLSVNSDALFRLATVKTDFDSPILQSVKLYDRTGFRGRSRWLPGFSYPKLSWFGFNNKASSLKILGGTVVLCDGNWFGGAKRYFFGYPWNTVSNLGQWNFSNRASSLLHF